MTGWVRRFAASDDGQLALYGDGISVGYRAFDPQGNEIGSGTADLNALGGFNFSIDVPDGANLGQARVEISLAGVGTNPPVATTHTFEMQEFRTPEFEVTARYRVRRPVLHGTAGHRRRRRRLLRRRAAA